MTISKPAKKTMTPKLNSSQRELATFLFAQGKLSKGEIAKAIGSTAAVLTALEKEPRFIREIDKRRRNQALLAQFKDSQDSSSKNLLEEHDVTE